MGSFCWVVVVRCDDEEVGGHHGVRVLVVKAHQDPVTIQLVFEPFW